MTLNLDKNTWKRVALGDVAGASKEKVDPASGDVERYIAGEHLDTDDLKIHRWGEVGDGYLGPAFHRRFRPGQVLYGSRRTYLRKVAVAEFGGVTANTTFVVETKDDSRLSQEFLPFIMSSEPFHAFAIAESKGSVNPYVNWTDIERYEFDLPPPDDQKRIADLLWALERHRLALAEALEARSVVEAAWTRDIFADLDWSLPLSDVVRADRPLCYGVVQPGVTVEDGVGLIRVMDLEFGAPSLSGLKHITTEIDRQYRRSSIEAGDVLVSIVGTIGRTWVVTDDFVGCNIARALARVGPNPDVMSPEFLSWVLASERLQEVLIAEAFESARKTLNLSALARIALPRLTVSEQNGLLRRRTKVSEVRVATDTEVATLAILRSSFLADIFGSAA